MPHHLGNRNNLHSHLWLMGLVGAAAGIFFLLYAPSLNAISASIFLFAGFHVVGALVLLGSLYSMGLRDLMRRGFGTAQTSDRHDFGWGPGWVHGLGIASLICIAGAILLQVSLPALWPLAFSLVLMAAGLFAGNQVMAGFRRADHVVLPMVDLLRSDADLVLDAGCGTGRTTIALSRILKRGKIIALDRFDASYIDDGGRKLLEHNLAIAGLTDRVRIEAGDLTAIPEAEATFDSAVSTHVFDHLGGQKAAALREMHRVLKPGGRFLMAVWTPGWTMFAVANVLSFFLTSKAAWRGMAKAAGFSVRDEGVFNGTWFMLLERPLSA